MSKVPLIAIVDDDELFRRAAGSLIRSLGYGVEPFTSAEAFLELDLIGETDCLITDVQMPGMTGIELQEKLIAQGNRLPVGIFVTAFPETEARRLRAGRRRDRFSRQTIQRSETDQFFERSTVCLRRLRPGMP